MLCNKNDADVGVRVKRVIPGAPAAVNGFQVDDHIEQMDSVPCENSNQVLSLVVLSASAWAD